LSLQEAERLAMQQDHTISIDGYSVPKDIGGYQVQAHYTNPYKFFATTGFSSSLGISVKALMQIWKSEIDLGQCKRLSVEADFDVLDRPELFLTDAFRTDAVSPRSVYADFTVIDCWDYEEWVHGTPTTFVMAKSSHAAEYLLCLNPLRTPYAFGVGETYTFVISYYQRTAQIGYAIQQIQGD